MLRYIWCLAIVSLAGAYLCQPSQADTAVWMRWSDKTLWRSSIPAQGKPVLIYGKGVDGMRLVAAPDGRHIATDSVPEGDAVMVFDTQQPGVRRTVPLSGGDASFLSQWTPDSSGLLASKDANDQEGTYLGLYRIDLNGHRTLITRQSRKDLVAASSATYSPSGQLLAVCGGYWLQIIRISAKNETILVKKEVDGGSGVTPAWIGEDYLVLAGTRGLSLVDVSKQSVKPWITYRMITSMTYSKARGKLYAVMQLSKSEEPALYSIDPKTSLVKAVPVEGLDAVVSIDGITADGKYALVLADAPASEESETDSDVERGLWTLDMDTGKAELLDKGAARATILPWSKGK